MTPDVYLNWDFILHFAAEERAVNEQNWLPAELPVNVSHENLFYSCGLQYPPSPTPSPTTVPSLISGVDPAVRSIPTKLEIPHCRG